MGDQYVPGKNVLHTNPKALITQATVDTCDNAIHMRGDVLFFEYPNGSKHDAAVVTKMTTARVSPVQRLIEQVHLNKEIDPAVPKAGPIGVNGLAEH